MRVFTHTVIVFKDLSNYKMSSCKQALIKAVNGHRFAFLSLGVSILVGIVIGVDGGMK